MFEFGLLPKALQRYNYFLKYAREVGAFLLFFVGCLWKPAVGLPIMSGQSPDFRSLISRSSLALLSVIVCLSSDYLPCLTGIFQDGDAIVWLRTKTGLSIAKTTMQREYLPAFLRSVRSNGSLY